MPEEKQLKRFRIYFLDGSQTELFAHDWGWNDSGWIIFNREYPAASELQPLPEVKVVAAYYQVAGVELMDG
jgi:hypothetical protein